MRLVWLSDQKALKEAGIHFSKGTLYNWRSKKKNLELFKKVGGKVFLDIDAYEKWIRQQEGNK